MFLSSVFRTVKMVGDYYQIRRFPLKQFVRQCIKYYGSSKPAKLLEAIGFSLWGDPYRSNNETVRVHKFFIPELLYLMKQFGMSAKYREEIRTNTWVGQNDGKAVSETANFSLIQREMDVTLRKYQEDFVRDYPAQRDRLGLNGFLLSFEQGLGKTVTALALMTALGKKMVLIIAPKNSLDTVWKAHIEMFYNQPKTMLLPGDEFRVDGVDYLIINYAAMAKLAPIMPQLAKLGNQLGIIVDESHNFLRMQSQQTQTLLDLQKATNTRNLLLMSGTPLKALGVEVIPILHALDPLFDDAAEAIFRKSLGVNTTIGTDIIKTRLGMIMHRQTKEILPELPEVAYRTISVSLPDGDAYTLRTVKQEALAYARDREKFHRAQMPGYVAGFDEALHALNAQPRISRSAEFKTYLADVLIMRKRAVSTMNPDDMARVRRCNEYEINVLEPALPEKLRKTFKAAKSAVKYLHLKIQGEVIGAYLSHKRIAMTSALVESAGLPAIIDGSTKKTVLFTSYIDAVETAETYLAKQGYTPVTVYSKTANALPSTVRSFIADDRLNPLIASTAMMATAVTLVVANTVVFLNKPWRHIDMDQAVARVHRIGQDTDVEVYTIVLDTGANPNLSTRMEEVLSWSREMFEHMV